MNIRLKTWAPSGLRQSDWDFSAMKDWPPQWIQKAWYWELERELGSGNSAFLASLELEQKELINSRWNADLDHSRPLSNEEQDELEKMWPESERPKPAIQRPKMLKCYPFRGLHSLIDPHDPSCDALHCPDPDPGVDAKYTRVYALQIEWELTETELIERFRNWLREGWHEFGPDWATPGKVWKRKRGSRKTEGYRAWLMELAVYRFSAAGITRPLAVKKLKKVLDELGLNEPSAANWAHAKQRTRERITQRHKELLTLRRYYREYDGEDLKNYFLTDSDLRALFDDTVISSKATPDK